MVRSMNAGSEYRSHCGPGDDAFAFVADEWSPVFVCQKAEFSQGTTSLTKVKYWTVRSFGIDELPLGFTHQHVEGVSADTVRKVLEKMR